MPLNVAIRGTFGSTSAGRASVIAAVNSLLTALRKAPPTLEAAVLDLLGIDGLRSSVEAALLIEVADSMLQLIAGKEFGTASTSKFMPGVRRGFEQSS